MYLIVHHIQFITYSQFHDPNIKIYHANSVNLVQIQTNYTKMFLTTWGVKPLKQFHIIISKSNESKL